MSVFGIDRSMQQRDTRVAPSPIVLTNAELLREADEVARRIAHSSLPVRDVRVVQELAARLGRTA